MSRNRVAQPFFVVSSEDQVLIQMAGEGSLELRETAPDLVTLAPGDTVYIPAGVPSRVVPRGENVQVRLKAEPPAREAVAWYCPGCGELVHAREVTVVPLQQGFWDAVLAFNADAALRTCSACGIVHPPAELGDIAWPAVAEALRADE